MTRKTRKTMMKNEHKDLNTILSSFNNNRERIKLLSETREILDYFYANTSNSRISPWFFASGMTLSCLTGIIFYHIKNDSITKLTEIQLLFNCAFTPVLILLLLTLFLLAKIKQFGRTDDITIQTCKKRSDWSAPALKISLKLISSTQESYEKRLNIFKLICGVFTFIITFIIPILTSKITDPDAPLHLLDLVLSDVHVTIIFLFVFTCISSIIIYTYVEFAFLTFHINICSKIKSSIGLLISVIDNELPELANNKSNKSDYSQSRNNQVPPETKNT